MKNKIIIGLAIFLLAISLTACGVQPLTNSQDATVGISPKEVKTQDITITDDLTVGDDLTVSGDAAVTGALAVTGNTTVTGNVAVTGTIIGDAKIVDLAPAGVYATTTLTAADSGKVYNLSGKGNTITLPAVTATGTTFTFVIGGAFDTGNFAITSAAGDDIEGSVIVAGAVVDCNAADALTFVADGENIGDFVTIVSNGTNWIPLQSGALSASKLTCSG